MIAPIKKTQAAPSSTSSQASTEPLPVCEACRGVDDFCVVADCADAVGDVAVDGGDEAGGGEADGALGAVVVGAPVGLSGNC